MYFLLSLICCVLSDCVKENLITFNFIRSGNKLCVVKLKSNLFIWIYNSALIIFQVDQYMKKSLFFFVFYFKDINDGTHWCPKSDQ